MGKASVRTKTDTALCTERRGACESRISHPELLVAILRLIYPAEHWGCVDWHQAVGLEGEAALCLQLLLGRCRKDRAVPMLSQGLLDGCLMGQCCGGTLSCVWPLGGWGHI